MTTAGTWIVLSGRYRLREHVATGGTGEVWRADDEMLGRTVAVKLLRPQYADDSATLVRFEAEARHAGGLHHPGIVGVYDYGRDPQVGVPFLVMELVDGPSLAAVLAAGPQSPRWVLDVIGQVAAALAVAHAAGLVHRDIKPGNLLLAPDGHVKITDFGIAAVAGSAPTTGAGMLVGTPGYLAPERATGASASPATDMYALGVVAWEALAGGPPFTGGPLDVAMSHARYELPPLPPQVPAGVAALVGALTARDPAARPSGTAAAAEAAALGAELASGPARTPTPPPGPPPGGPNDTLMLTGIGIPPAPPAPSARPASHRRRGGILEWPRSAFLLGGVFVAALIALAAVLAARGGGGQPAQAPSVSASAPTAASAATQTVGSVMVDNATLDGQQADAVVAQLRKDGLQPRLVWVRNDNYQDGAVITIQPAGAVSPGAVVTVTAAGQPQGQGKDHHNGDSNGN